MENVNDGEGEKSKTPFLHLSQIKNILNFKICNLRVSLSPKESTLKPTKITS